MENPKKLGRERRIRQPNRGGHPQALHDETSMATQFRRDGFARHKGY